MPSTARYRAEPLVLVRPCTNAVFTRAFEGKVTGTIPGAVRLGVTPTLSGVPLPGRPPSTNGAAIRIFVTGRNAPDAQRVANEAAERLCRTVSEDYAAVGVVAARADKARVYSYFRDRLQPGIAGLFTHRD